MMEAKATSRPEGRPRPERNRGGSARDRTQGRGSLPAKLAQVNEAARRSRQTRFTALLHHVDDEALHRAFRRQRRAASAGVDGVTVADYEQNLDANIRELCDRVHTGRYRPQPVRRTFIPKADGGRSVYRRGGHSAPHADCVWDDGLRCPEWATHSRRNRSDVSLIDMA